VRWFAGCPIFTCEDFKRLGKIEGDCCDCLIPTRPSAGVNEKVGLDHPTFETTRILVCCRHIHQVRTIPYGWWEFEKIKLRKEDPRYHTSLPGYGAKEIRQVTGASNLCIVCKKEPVKERGLGQNCLDLMQSLRGSSTADAG